MFSTRTGTNYRLADGLLTLIALQLSFYLRTTIELGQPILSENAAISLPLFLLTLIIWQTVFELIQVYSAAPRPFRVSMLRRLLQAHAVATLTFCGVLYVFEREFSRLQALYFVVVLFALLVGYRLVWFALRRLSGYRIGARRRVLIVGISDYAYEIGRIIKDYSSAGLNLVGFVPHRSDQPAVDTPNVLGTFDQLNDILASQPIDEVVVCDESQSRGYLLQLTDMLGAFPVNVRLAPNYSDLAYFHVSVEDFGGAPLISLRYDMLTRRQRLTKRIFDMIGATMLLIAALLPMLVIAAAIKLDSDGPVFFRQPRVGERGKLFTVYKFRTMVWDAESRIIYTQNYKQADDPRVTRVGKWLRRTSFDEIPQFVNVLKGDMSLVGPRPELPHIVQFYSPWQRKRFEVPQGITGWWQINGRADLPMYEHVDYDMFYIRNYSIWLDLQILARTPAAIIKGRGAY